MSIFNNITEEIIQNINTSWRKCKDNHIFIENINNNQIICNDIITYHNIPLLDINKRTLYFDKCKLLDIIIENKFNHILLVNSSDINLYVTNGVISGLDILNCNNINIFLNNKIDYTEMSNSENCNYVYNTLIDNNIVYVNTNNCYNINFNINYINYTTNQSYFSEKKYSTFSNYQSENQ